MDVSMTITTQASRFLERLQAMDEASETAFRRIYSLSPHGAGFVAIGQHVRVAMVEALNHAPIAHWVRLNLALRVGLKLAQTTQQSMRALRLEASLEDFHIASEAYIANVSLIQAAIRRQERLVEKTTTVKEARVAMHAIPAIGAESFSPEIVEELHAIHQFKSKIIPGFVQAIRRAGMAS